MFAPHSCTPSNPSLWAFQEDIGRNVRVDVDTTNPEPSPEYIRSLSREMKRVVTVEE